jgi:hypothetical protein
VRHQPGLDGLAETDLVGQDAPAVRNAFEREDHRVDLVRVGIDAGRALGRDKAAVLLRTAPTNQILREVQTL